MLIRGGATLKPQEQKLLKLFRALGESQRETVTSFLEFLLTQGGKEHKKEALQPEKISRPEKESVVKAIKRLKTTYPMLDQNKLFHETSQHMTSHMLNGKTAHEVIDELESMFARHYQSYLEELGFSNVPDKSNLPVKGT